MARRAEIAALLHGRWLERLRWEWQRANRDCLDGRLRAPVLRIDRDRGNDDRENDDRGNDDRGNDDTANDDRENDDRGNDDRGNDDRGNDDFGGRLGAWQREGRILSIHERHIFEHAWHEVVATLRHEMAHQYVDELLGGEGRPHGPRFSQLCERLGIRAEASGRPARGDDRAQRILRRVRKLLALAESHNPHEAQAAMAAANTLLLKYNLALPELDDPVGYSRRILGRSAAALPLSWKLIGGVLSEFFFVDCVWVTTWNPFRDREERVLEILGTDANLDFAAYVHDFLHAEIERLWRHHAPRTAGGRGRKREFQAGVLMGFRDRLRRERRLNEERGLVWVGDAGLKAFAHRAHPRLHKLGGGGVRLTGAHEAGRRAGSELQIHRPIAHRGEGGGLLGRE